MDKKDNTTCMACACPCDMHKEHTHGEKESDTSMKCEMCGHEHKNDGACDCGCK